MNPQGITTIPGQREKGLIYVAVETCAHCNRCCSFCPTNNTVIFPKEFMPRELFVKIIGDLVAVDYRGEFSLYGHNEALLDARLPEFTEFVSLNLPHCTQTLSTNGDKLTPQLAWDLFNAGLSSLLVNMYDDRNDLRRRMGMLADTAAKQGFHVYRFNVNEAFPMRIHPGEKTFIVNDASRYGEGFQGIDNRAGNVAAFAPIAAPLAKNCARPFNHAHIKYNGKMVLCCQDWSSEVVLGDCNVNTVAEIYNGELAEHYRQRLGAKNRVGLKVCETCSRGCD